MYYALCIVCCLLWCCVVFISALSTALSVCCIAHCRVCWFCVCCILCVAVWCAQRYTPCALSFLRVHKLALATQGLYFANRFSKSRNYCRTCHGGLGVMLLCDVAMGYTLQSSPQDWADNVKIARHIASQKVLVVLL